MTERPTSVELPPDFAEGPYLAVYLKLRERQTDFPVAWPQWAAAWNAVGFRYRAAVDDDELVRQLVAANSPDRYAEERALFGFFVGACSAIESTAYGLFAIGAMLLPDQFLLASPSQQAKVSLATTYRRFRREFPDDPMTMSLAAAIDDVDFKEVRLIRNVLAHRSAPSRHLFRGGEDDGRADWELEGYGLTNLDLIRGPTARYRLVVARLLRSVLEAADTFVAARF